MSADDLTPHPLAPLRYCCDRAPLGHAADCWTRRPIEFTPVEGDPDPDAIDAACEWADYRKHYGVNPYSLTEAHKAFLAGWAAARGHSHEGVQR